MKHIRHEDTSFHACSVDPSYFGAPDMPHDGYLADFLMKAKGFLRRTTSVCRRAHQSDTWARPELTPTSARDGLRRCTPSMHASRRRYGKMITTVNVMYCRHSNDVKADRSTVAELVAMMFLEFAVFGSGFVDVGRSCPIGSQ